METVEINLAYEETGTGIPLVFLHGFPLDRSIWRPLAGRLSADARCILPDLRGHGQSPAPDGVYEMSQMGEDVLRLLDRLKIEKAVFCGHSMGGYIALALARAYPRRTAGLILMSTQAVSDSPEARARRFLNAEDVRQNGMTHMAENMASKFSADPRWTDPMREIILKASPQGTMGALRGMANRADATAWLSSFRFPVLVIAGAKDGLIPGQVTLKMGKTIPHAQLYAVPEGGHLLMLEAEETVAGVILDWLVKVK